MIAALVELVDVRSLVALYRFHARGAGRVFRVAARPDFAAALATLLGVLVFDTLPGLFIGVVVSVVLLVYRASRPHIAVLGRVPGTRGQWGDVARHPENEAVPGIVVLRPESGLWFANADVVRDAIRAEATGGTRAVVVDAETVPAIDVTAVGMLVQLAEDLAGTGSRSFSLGTSARCAISSRPVERSACSAAIRPCRRRSTSSPASPEARTRAALSCGVSAGVAELADAPGLGPGGLRSLEVRLLSPA